MYIFTPNTLIKSSEINANFAELDTKLTAIYAYGTLGNEFSGAKTFVETANSGITATTTKLYTITTRGLYIFHAQQLVNTTGGATNFFSYVNGTIIHHGWQPNLQTDLITTFTRILNVGDTVSCGYDSGIGNVWGGDHSVYYLNMLKAL